MMTSAVLWHPRLVIICEQTFPLMGHAKDWVSGLIPLLLFIPVSRGDSEIVQDMRNSQMRAVSRESPRPSQ